MDNQQNYNSGQNNGNNGSYVQNNSNNTNVNNPYYAKNFNNANNGNYSQNNNNTNYGNYSQNYNNTNNGNYAGYDPNQNGYYNQNNMNPNVAKGGISDIIFAIFGIIANLLLLISTFVPVIKLNAYRSEKNKIYLWDMFKSAKKIIKSLSDSHSDMNVEDIVSLLIILMIIITTIVIAIASLVYLIRYIIILCTKKKVSKCLESNGALVLSLFFLRYASLKTVYFYKMKSVSSVMIIIALSILVVCSIFSGYISNMHLAKKSAKTYHLQFVFNFFVSIFTSVMLFCSFSPIIKAKASYTTAKYGIGVFIYGFLNTLANMIDGVRKSYYSSLTSFKNDCKLLSIYFVIMMLAIVIINIQIKNLKEAIKNINVHFNLGSRIMVRSIVSIILLIALQIVIAANHKKLQVKSSPTTFFVVFMIFSCLNIIVVIIKKILETSVTDSCIELIDGTKNKLRKNTISSIILNSIGVTLLVIVSVVTLFSYDMLENTVKKKIKDSYYNSWDDYDWDDFDYDDFDYDDWD